jgi:hypothetical protein
MSMLAAMYSREFANNLRMSGCRYANSSVALVISFSELFCDIFIFRPYARTGRQGRFGGGVGAGSGVFQDVL